MWNPSKPGVYVLSARFVPTCAQRGSAHAVARDLVVWTKEGRGTRSRESGETANSSRHSPKAVLGRSYAGEARGTNPLSTSRLGSARTDAVLDGARLGWVQICAASAPLARISR